jgi:hypothetical protein
MNSSEKKKKMQFNFNTKKVVGKNIFEIKEF